MDCARALHGPLSDRDQSVPSGFYLQADGSYQPMTDAMCAIAPPPQPDAVDRDIAPAPTALKLQSDEPAPDTPAPGQERNDDDDAGVVYLRRRANALGFEPLPRRPAQAE